MKQKIRFIWGLFVVILFAFSLKEGLQKNNIDIRVSGQALAVIFSSIYYLVFRLIVNKKEKKCAELLNELGKSDSTWDREQLKKRVELIFNKLIEAKVNRNLEIMKNFMTDQYFEAFKKYLEKMAKTRGKNLIKDVEIHDIEFVNLQNYKENSKDLIEVCLRYSMIDCLVGETYGLLMEGDDKNPNEYTELWIFCRSDNDWLLDEIVSNPAISEVLFSQNKVENDNLGSGQHSA